MQCRENEQCARDEDVLEDVLKRVEVNDAASIFCWLIIIKLEEEVVKGYHLSHMKYLLLLAKTLMFPIYLPSTKTQWHVSNCLPPPPPPCAVDVMSLV